MVVTYGGHDKTNPSTNYNSNIQILQFKFDGTVVYQERTKTLQSCLPHTTSTKKGDVPGSYFPPLTMSAMASTYHHIFLWGGLDLNNDIVSNELYVFEIIR